MRQLDSVQTRFDNVLNNGTCSICLDTYTCPTMISCCSNVYCAECIVNAQIVQKKCPMCRSSNFKIHRVETNGNPVDPKTFETEQPLTKVNVLHSILETDEIKKILVYSEWDSIMPLLTELSREYNFELLHLQGFSSARAKMLEKYTKEGSRVIMFANGITDCSGLNLPSTTDIVLWHKMDSYKTQQITGRCRRVSTNSAHHCNVHFMYPETRS